jgi:hypothetical protein
VINISALFRIKKIRCTDKVHATNGHEQPQLSPLEIAEIKTS